MPKFAIKALIHKKRSKILTAKIHLNLYRKRKKKPSKMIAFKHLIKFYSRYNFSLVHFEKSYELMNLF